MPAQPSGPLDTFHEQLRSALDAHLASLSNQYEEALERPLRDSRRGRPGHDGAARSGQGRVGGPPRDRDRDASERSQSASRGRVDEGAGRGHSEWAARLDHERRCSRANRTSGSRPACSQARAEADRSGPPSFSTISAPFGPRRAASRGGNPQKARSEVEQDWTVKLEQATATLRTDRRELAAERARTQSEVEQHWTAKLEQETTTLRADAEERLGGGHPEGAIRGRAAVGREAGTGNGNAARGCRSSGSRRRC